MVRFRVASELVKCVVEVREAVGNVMLVHDVIISGVEVNMVQQIIQFLEGDQRDLVHVADLWYSHVGHVVAVGVVDAHLVVGVSDVVGAHVESV